MVNVSNAVMNTVNTVMAVMTAMLIHFVRISFASPVVADESEKRYLIGKFYHMCKI